MRALSSVFLLLAFVAGTALGQGSPMTVLIGNATANDTQAAANDKQTLMDDLTLNIYNDLLFMLCTAVFILNRRLTIRNLSKQSREKHRFRKDIRNQGWGRNPTFCQTPVPRFDGLVLPAQDKASPLGPRRCFSSGGPVCGPFIWLECLLLV